MSWNDWSQFSRGAIRFRGNVLELYESGHWSRDERIETMRREPQTGSRFLRGDVIQTIEFEVAGNNIVFASGFVTSGVESGTEKRIRVDRFGWVAQAERRDDQPIEARSFQLELSPIDIPFPGRVTSYRRETIPHPYAQMALSINDGVRTPVEAWVKSVLAKNAEDAPSGQYEIAKRLESHLMDSGEYLYSLDLSVDDPTADPIVDFLLNRKTGHCEYFASALAIALRTQDIPTRLVSGFKGGRIDPETGELTVQELHAHAWLEAYIEDVPDNPLTGQFGPRWIPLDPTPAARDAQVIVQEAEGDSLWFQFTSWWTSLWDSAIRMNRNDQRALVYQPLEDAMSGIVADLKALGSGGSQSSLRRLLSSPERWISLQGGIVVFCLLLVATGSVWGLKRLSSFMRSAKRQLAQGGTTVTIVPFYQELMRLLLEHGWSKSDSQTPREFADQVGLDMNSNLSRPQAAVPREITEQYYSVRFGRRSVSPSIGDQIQEQLLRLRQSLDRTPSLNPGPVDTTTEGT